MILGPRIRLGFGDILNTDRVIMRTNKITSNLKAPFFAAGTDEVLLQDFDRISHTGRFSERPVLVGLVNFIVGKGGGANRDSPLLELCYLVYAIRILSNEPSKQDAFFLGLPISSPLLTCVLFFDSAHMCALLLATDDKRNSKKCRKIK